MLINILYLIIGYVFGWIEGALLISYIFGKFDIRNKGSGNAGASNITVIMGWKYGFLVALIDILKAFIPMTIAKFTLNASFTQIFILGFGVIIGHIYPLPFKFKGGKGAASFVGFSYALDFRLGLFMNILIISLTIITNYIFIGTLCMFFTLPLILIYFEAPSLTVLLSLVIAAIGLIKHISNIQNLKSGKETGLRSTLKKNK